MQAVVVVHLTPRSLGRENPAEWDCFAEDWSTARGYPAADHSGRQVVKLALVSPRNHPGQVQQTGVGSPRGGCN